MAVQLVVMSAAQWHRELVADLAAQRPGLSEFQVVGIARSLLANQAGLPADEQQVGLAALAGRFLGMGEPGLVRGCQRWLQRGLGACSSCPERLRRQALRSLQAGLLAGRVGGGTRGVLKLAPISGLDEPGVRLQKGILERNGGLGPSK